MKQKAMGEKQDGVRKAEGLMGGLALPRSTNVINVPGALSDKKRGSFWLWNHIGLGRGGRSGSKTHSPMEHGLSSGFIIMCEIGAVIVHLSWDGYKG